MINLIKILIFGHLHKWEIIRENRLTYENSSGTRYYLQCKRCGNIKNKDVI